MSCCCSAARRSTCNNEEKSLDAASLRSASCRLLLATVKALPASDEDGVGRMRRLGRCAIARGALRGARLQDRRRGVPLDVQSQLDNGQAKYVYPIGVHSGEYLGTLLNRTSASGCGYHFDVLEQPPATRLGKRPHAGSPVAPPPERRRP